MAKLLSAQALTPSDMVLLAWMLPRLGGSALRRITLSSTGDDRQGVTLSS
jgi:hypothetical protein